MIDHRKNNSWCSTLKIVYPMPKMKCHHIRMHTNRHCSGLGTSRIIKLVDQTLINCIFHTMFERIVICGRSHFEKIVKITKSTTVVFPCYFEEKQFKFITLLSVNISQMSNTLIWEEAVFTQQNEDIIC